MKVFVKAYICKTLSKIAITLGKLKVELSVALLRAKNLIVAGRMVRLDSSNILRHVQDSNPLRRQTNGPRSLHQNLLALQTEKETLDE